MSRNSLRPAGRRALKVRTGRGSNVSAAAADTLESRVLFAAVSVTSHCFDEPPAGPSAVTFTVSLDEPAASAIRVDYATTDGGAIAARDYKSDGGAKAGRDYTAVAGRLTFAPGETTKTVAVPLLADALVEGDETFCLNVSVFNGPGTIDDGQGVAMILANSGRAAPAVSSLPVGDGSAATFTGTNGRPVRVQLRGPGSGTLTLLGGGAAALELSGTTADSALTIAGATSLHDSSVDGSLRSFVGKSADLAGDLDVSGSLATLVMRNARGGGVLNVAGASAGGVPLSVTLAHVCDYGLVAPAFGAVRVDRWMDTDAEADVVAADSIGSLTVKDCFQADVEAASIGRIVIGGAMSGADVIAATEIDAVRVTRMLDSRIFVGVIGGAAADLPDARGDFAPVSRLGSLTVGGNGTAIFTGSSVAAVEIGTVSLATVRAANAGDAFGVYADRIDSVSGTSIETGSFSLARLETPHTARAEIDFRIRVV